MTDHMEPDHARWQRIHLPDKGPGFTEWCWLNERERWKAIRANILFGLIVAAVCVGVMWWNCR